MNYPKPAFMIKDELSSLSPVQTMVKMFEYTDKEGYLSIPEWPYDDKDYDEPDMYYLCKMNWSQEDLKNVIEDFQKLEERITEDAVEKMNQVLQVARMQEDFGNGRYVRSMIEKARMAQAERLLSMDVDQIGRKEIETICAEDIPLPEASKVKKTEIGFRCA